MQKDLQEFIWEGGWKQNLVILKIKLICYFFISTFH